jgi:hypothetical protein
MNEKADGPCVLGTTRAKAPLPGYLLRPFGWAA